MELTEDEKEILKLCFKLMKDIINVTGFIEINYSINYSKCFDRDNLFYLAEKLGIEDY